MRKILSLLLTLILTILCLCPASNAAYSILNSKEELLSQWESGEAHGITYMAFSPKTETAGVMVAEEAEVTEEAETEAEPDLVALLTAEAEPVAETETQQQKYPLVVLLHGKYSGTSNGEQVSESDFYRWSSAEYQAKFAQSGGAYILMPRCPGGDSSSWSVESHHDELKKLIDTFVAEHADTIDTSRIYLGGWSKGGAGTIKMAVKYPDFFAALIVIAPHYTVNTKHLKALSGTPIWLVACKKDTTATYSTMAKAFWNTLRETTDVPSMCRFTTFNKYNYYDTASHAVQHAVGCDLLGQPSDCGMYTENAKGEKIITDETSGIISWLSSIRLGEIEKEDVCRCECHGSKCITKFIWLAKRTFFRIFDPSMKVCSCGKNHW